MNDFEDAIRDLAKRFDYPVNFHQALIDVNDTISFAKKILLTNRVQSFTASDVVELTRIVIERENVLNLRDQEEK